MKIQLTRVTRSRKGHPIRAQSVIEADAPTIGRGASCAIHLSDPRVALEHASVFTSQGVRRVTGVGGAMLMVDGHAAGDLVLAPGSHFEVGPYAFAVEPAPEGADIALAVELVRPLPDSLAEIVAKSTFSLEQGGGFGKRRAAWFGLVAMLVLFLAAPVINATMPGLRKETASHKLAPDIAWNPGPLSSGHEALAYDCGACHRTPFLRVRDHECLQCHEKMPGHVRDSELQARLFGGTRCAECHLDHRGADVPVRADAALCSACHAAIRKAYARSDLENASDFASNHPEFKLALWRGPGPDDVVRVKQSDKAKLVATLNLKFPHDQHLKPGLKGPEGRETLTCATCHAPDPSAKGFVAIDMNKHCLRCHELRFEPAVTTRQVPHGSVEDAWLLIQEFYANISLGDIPVDTTDTGAIRRLIPRPSEAITTPEQRARALSFARTKAQKVGVDLFEKRVCIVCHDVRRSSTELPTEGTAVPWTVPPVHVANRWMPKAHFDHGKHRTAQTECKDCHKIERSHKSSDVAMPDIATCRGSGCHAGSEPVPGKVVSTCIDCHDYHLALPHVKPQRAASISNGEPKQ